MNLRAIFLGFLMVAVFGCGEGPAEYAGPVLLDIPSLAFASADSVDQVLGAPVSVTPIENVSSQMPGEFRDYAVEGADPVMIRFYRGRAVFFTVYLPRPEASAEAALQAVGINVDGPPDTDAPMAHWWRNGTIGGKRYEKVGAVTGLGGEESGFETVQAEFVP